MMNKKFTVILSLLLAATLTIPAFAGTTALAAEKSKKLDTVAQYTVVVDDKDTGVEIPVMVPLRKMAKATGMKVTKKGKQIRFSTKSDDQTQIPNPFVDYQTLAEAEKAAGYTIKLPEQIEGYKQTAYSVMSAQMLQVVYEKDASQITIRKEAGTDDISGVYIDYAKKEAQTIGGHQTELRGDGTHVYVAVWNQNGYTYSVYADAGVTAAQMSALVESIQ